MGNEHILFICYVEKTDTTSSILNIGRIEIDNKTKKAKPVAEIIKIFRDGDADTLYSVLTDASNKDGLGFYILNKLEVSDD